MEVMEKPKTVQVPKSNNDSVERIHEIFEKQKANLQQLKNASIKDRKKKLNTLKKAIFTWRERIQDAVHKDFKRAKTETDIIEIYPAISEIKHVANNLYDWASPMEVDTPITYMGSSSYVHYEPKGNTLIITPWNYPFFLSVSPIVYAIAAGNAVILKPSEFTPNTSQLLKEMLAEVFEENEVAVLQGDHHVSTELLKLKFDHVHFTGSPMVGKIVMKAAAEHLTTCTLELGGKSPTIVDETANVKEAGKKIAWGKWINAGQTCVAPDYILVHKSKKDAFVGELKKNIEKTYSASENNDSDFCRMVNAKHYNRVKGYVEEAASNGASVDFGGNFNDETNYIAPTVVSSVSHESKLMQDEIFGPVLPIIEYEDLDEALKIINGKEKPLALYIFSKKRKNIDKIINHTSAGGTCVNETVLHVSQVNLPFGGINNSGVGKSHGKWGLLISATNAPS